MRAGCQSFSCALQQKQPKSCEWNWSSLHAAVLKFTRNWRLLWGIHLWPSQTEQPEMPPFCLGVVCGKTWLGFGESIKVNPPLLRLWASGKVKDTKLASLSPAQLTQRNGLTLHLLLEQQEQQELRQEQLVENSTEWCLKNWQIRKKYAKCRRSLKHWSSLWSKQIYVRKQHLITNTLL